jgi:hypothetical protein
MDDARRIRIVLSLAVLVAAAGGLVACAHPKVDGAGGIDAVPSGSPQPVLTTGTPGATAPATTAPTSTSTKKTGGGGSTGDGGQNLTVTYDKPADIDSADCPQSFGLTLRAHIDHAPATGTIQYTNADGSKSDPMPVTWKGTGPVTLTSTESYTQMVAYTDTYTIGADVKLDGSGESKHVDFTFAMHCGGKVTGMAPATKRSACPFETAFSATVSVPTAESVHYQWHLNDGTVIDSGTLTFTAAGSQKLTSPTVTVLTKSTKQLYAVTLHLTDKGSRSATGTASCSVIETP